MAELSSLIFADVKTVGGDGKSNLEEDLRNVNC